MRHSFKLRVAFKQHGSFAFVRTIKAPHDELAHETVVKMLNVEPKHQNAVACLQRLVSKHIKCLDLSVCVTDVDSILTIDAEALPNCQKVFIGSCQQDKLLTAMFRDPSNFEHCEPLRRLYPRLFTTGKASMTTQTQVLVVDHKLSMKRVTILVAAVVFLLATASVTLGLADHSLSNGLAVFASMVSLATVVQTGVLVVEGLGSCELGTCVRRINTK